MKSIRNKIVILGSDYNGFELKKIIWDELTSMNYIPMDIGSYDTNKVDFTRYINTVNQIISDGDAKHGILISGVMIDIGSDYKNTNVLCLGSWQIPVQKNLKIVKKWLKRK